MNTATKLLKNSDKSEINNFSVSKNLHPRVIAGINGTPAGVYALSESLKRNDPYLQVQETLNIKCLPERNIQLSNILKEATHV